MSHDEQAHLLAINAWHMDSAKCVVIIDIHSFSARCGARHGSSRGHTAWRRPVDQRTALVEYVLGFPPSCPPSLSIKACLRAHVWLGLGMYMKLGIWLELGIYS